MGVLQDISEAERSCHCLYPQSLLLKNQCCTISFEGASLPMHLTEPVFFSHPFQSRTALEKGGLQLLGPRLTPGKTQPKKVLSNTDGDELLHCLSLI